MSFILKHLAFFILTACFWLIPLGHSTVILRSKGKHVLIHLEGLKTKKGAYFDAINMDGESRGIVRITKVGDEKATGVVEFGQAVKRWSLEPTSRVRVARIKKKKRQLARIQREKLKRRWARKRRMNRQAYQTKRGVASGQYILEDLPVEEGSYQSDEILNYDKQEDLSLYQPKPQQGGFQGSQGNLAQQGKFQAQQGQAPPSQAGFEFSKAFPRVSLGLSPSVEYNVMKLTNPSKELAYLMQGMGFGLFGNVDLAFNSFIRLEGFLGFKQFSVSAGAETCQQKQDCLIQINYATAGGGLKFNLLHFKDHKLWFAIRGDLMYPVAYVNKSPLAEENFYPLHGSLGGALGFDFSIGNVVIPLSLGANLYIPPTETALVGQAGLQLGLLYSF